MAYQKRPYYCGPASLQTALRLHGKSVSQKRLAELMGTDESGSDEHDIITALDALGCQFDEFFTDRYGDAVTLLNMAAGWPLLLCVDSWDHWVCVAGACGERLFVHDPANEPWNTHHHGVWPLTTKSILRRWRTARRVREGGPVFYGISILAMSK